MFNLNDDLSIYATRGDIVFFSVSAEDDGKPYMFQPGDVVRIKVYGKKDAEAVVLQKDFPVTAATQKVEIFLTEEDTKIGEVISKPKDYWYEVELNPGENPQTIIGYDEDGAKVFKLFPEGDDIPPYEPIKPEDIPVVDDELDLTSTRPVENRSIARAIVQLRAKAYDLAEGLAVEQSRIDNIVSIESRPDLAVEPLEYLSEITEDAKTKISGSLRSDGVNVIISVQLREANMFLPDTEMDVFIIPDRYRPREPGWELVRRFGVGFSIHYDGTLRKYVLRLDTNGMDFLAPSEAGIATFTYPLDNYELKDIRVGADGVTYESAGTAVRSQFEKLTADVKKILAFMETFNKEV